MVLDQILAEAAEVISGNLCRVEKGSPEGGQFTACDVVGLDKEALNKEASATVFQHLMAFENPDTKELTAGGQPVPFATIKGALKADMVGTSSGLGFIRSTERMEPLAIQYYTRGEVNVEVQGDSLHRLVAPQTDTSNLFAVGPLQFWKSGGKDYDATVDLVLDQDHLRRMTGAPEGAKIAISSPGLTDEYRFTVTDGGGAMTALGAYALKLDSQGTWHFFQTDEGTENFPFIPGLKGAGEETLDRHDFRDARDLVKASAMREFEEMGGSSAPLWVSDLEVEAVAGKQYHYAADPAHNIEANSYTHFKAPEFNQETGEVKLEFIGPKTTEENDVYGIPKSIYVPKELTIPVDAIAAAIGAKEKVRIVSHEVVYPDNQEYSGVRRDYLITDENDKEWKLYYRETYDGLKVLTLESRENDDGGVEADDMPEMDSGPLRDYLKSIPDEKSIKLDYTPHYEKEEEEESEDDENSMFSSFNDISYGLRNNINEIEKKLKQDPVDSNISPAERLERQEELAAYQNYLATKEEAKDISFDSTEEDVLGRYFGNDSREIGQEQQAAETRADLPRDVLAFEAAVNSMPKVEGVLWHGRRGYSEERAQKFVAEHKPGTEFKFKRTYSGTPERSVAKGFTTNLLLKVHGKTSRAAGWFSGHSGELEALFPRATKYRVDKTYKDGTYHVVEVTEIEEAHEESVRRTNILDEATQIVGNLCRADNGQYVACDDTSETPLTGDQIRGKFRAAMDSDEIAGSPIRIGQVFADKDAIVGHAANFTFKNVAADFAGGEVEFAPRTHTGETLSIPADRLSSLLGAKFSDSVEVSEITQNASHGAYNLVVRDQDRTVVNTFTLDYYLQGGETHWLLTGDRLEADEPFGSEPGSIVALQADRRARQDAAVAAQTSDDRFHVNLREPRTFEPPTPPPPPPVDPANDLVTQHKIPFTQEWDNVNGVQVDLPIGHLDAITRDPALLAPFLTGTVDINADAASTSRPGHMNARWTVDQDAITFNTGGVNMRNIGDGDNILTPGLYAAANSGQTLTIDRDLFTRMVGAKDGESIEINDSPNIGKAYGIRVMGDPNDEDSVQAKFSLFYRSPADAQLLNDNDSEIYNGTKPAYASGWILGTIARDPEANISAQKNSGNEDDDLAAREIVIATAWREWQAQGGVIEYDAGMDDHFPTDEPEEDEDEENYDEDDADQDREERNDEYERNRDSNGADLVTFEAGGNGTPITTDNTKAVDRHGVPILHDGSKIPVDNTTIAEDLGVPNKTIAMLAGALEGQHVKIVDNGFGLSGDGDGVQLVTTGGRGGLLEVNLYDGGTMEFAREFPPEDSQGQGEGTRIFATIVTGARAAGYTNIKMHCIGDYNTANKSGKDRSSGYIVRVKQGGDAALSHVKFRYGARDEIERLFPGAQTIGDIVNKPGGMDWFYKNGGEWTGGFDTRDGSYSMKRFGSYLKRKFGTNPFGPQNEFPEGEFHESGLRTDCLDEALEVIMGNLCRDERGRFANCTAFADGQSGIDLTRLAYDKVPDLQDDPRFVRDFALKFGGAADEVAGVYLRGEEVFTKAGSHSAIAFTKDEQAQMKDAVFIHNHPEGSSFSFDDLAVAFRQDVAEMRAVSSVKLPEAYGAGESFQMVTLKRPPGGWPALSRLTDVLEDIKDDVTNEFIVRAERGEVTFEWANFTLHDEIVKRVVRTLGMPADTYKRVVVGRPTYAPQS